MNPLSAVSSRAARWGAALAVMLAVYAPAHAEPWTLARVLDAARGHDPALRAAHATGAAGRAQAAQQWAYLAPHVALSAGFTRADDPAMLFSQKLWQGRFTAADFALPSLNEPAATSARQWALTWDQPLWNGGREWMAPVLANRYARAASGMERAAVADRLLAAAQAWVGALSARGHSRAADQGLAAAAEMRRATAERFRTGQVAEVDTLRAAARAADARVRALGAQQQLAVALEQLSGIVGTPVGAPELEDETPALPDAPAGGERGELAASRAAAAAASLESKQAALALLPSLNSRFAVTQYAPATGDRWERRWMLAVGAELPVFDGAQRLNAWRAARAHADAARSGAQALARDLAVGVAAARAEDAVAGARAEAARAGHAAAEEALRLALSRYAAGLLPLSELIASDAEATAARAADIDATAAVTLARYRLLHALGELR